MVNHLVVAPVVFKNGECDLDISNNESVTALRGAMTTNNRPLDNMQEDDF